ncbi:L,D-transpeptidase family protein [Sphingorhabdus sp. 109]|jgi:murein L,D-transpeptidase YcbB/YkuD|uniref:L,D-transpeptidase family protein n=1 Tax=Sphingorhabdus sp. 109 TaxID=2653173 RepID=UPI0012F00E4F|nr:L,D-transpeptidase family protein [Sphingorhabdus sp. 109]VWX58425.1 Murein L,D-transpeptidase [Sphingorhabdus sp. 109]
MKICIALLSGFLFASAALAQSADQRADDPQNHLIWTESQIIQLQQLVDTRASEALAHCSISDFSQPNSASDPYRRSRLASVAANELMQAYLEGCSPASARAKWHSGSDDRYIDTQQLLMKALLHDDLAGYFDALRPRNPHYKALRAAYSTESDEEKRATLAVNLERWRWMRLVMGEKYLLVNAASFEVTLWENDRAIKSWPVIVGKTTSPTPVFEATVSGVILNPWWEIPTSIVAEGIGSLVRNNPAAARRKGYVVQNGRYRQRPGPGNALGQMKLVMPNPYSIYLHDTPNKERFSEAVRTFSHGCIRVGNAIDLDKTLLEGSATPAQVDAILASRKTTKLSLLKPIPVYIAYFTAEAGEGGSIRYFPDVYKRDSLKLAQNEPRLDCAA